MRASVFVGTSLDGFIARSNGNLDFLPPGGGEPHGYDEFIASVDAIVIGRQTFETVPTMKPWPYGDKRVVVLSSRPVEFSAVVGGVVEQMAGSPGRDGCATRRYWRPTPLHRWWNDNSTVPARRIDSTSDYHSRARALGDGISLFGSLPRAFPSVIS